MGNRKPETRNVKPAIGVGTLTGFESPVSRFLFSIFFSREVQQAAETSDQTRDPGLGTGLQHAAHDVQVAVSHGAVWRAAKALRRSTQR